MEEFENLEETPERLAELHSEFMDALPKAIQALCERNPKSGVTVAEIRKYLEQQCPSLKGFLSSAKVLGHLNQMMRTLGLEAMKLPGEKVYRYILKKPAAEPTSPETDEPLKPTKQLCGGVGSGPARPNKVLASGEDKPITTPAAIELPHHKKERSMADKKKRGQEGPERNEGDDPVVRRIKWLMRLSYRIKEVVDSGVVSENALEAYPHYVPVFVHDDAGVQYEKDRQEFEKRASSIEVAYYDLVETSDDAATEIYRLIRRVSDERLLALCGNDRQMVKTWRDRNANQWQDRPPTDVMPLIKILKSIKLPAAKPSELDPAATQAALEAASRPHDAAKQSQVEPPAKKEEGVKDTTEPRETEELEVGPPDPEAPAAGAEANKTEDKPAAAAVDEAPKAEKATAAAAEPVGEPDTDDPVKLKELLNRERFKNEALRQGSLTAEEERKSTRKRLDKMVGDLEEYQRLGLLLTPQKPSASSKELADAFLALQVDLKRLRKLFEEEQKGRAEIDKARKQFVEDCGVLGLQPEDWVSQVRKIKKVQADLAAAQAAAKEHEQCAARTAELEGKLKKAETDLTNERADRATSDASKDKEVAELRKEFARLKAIPDTPLKGGETMAESQKVPPHKVAMIKNRLYLQLAPDSHLKYADDVLAGMPETAIDAHIVELQQEIAQRDEIAKLAKRAFKMQGQLNDPKKAQGLDDLKGDPKEDLEEYIEQLEEAIEAKEKAEADRAARTEPRAEASAATAPAAAPAEAVARAEGEAVVAPSLFRRYRREAAALVLILLVLGGLGYWDWARKAKTAQSQTPVAETPSGDVDASQPSYEEWLEIYRAERKKLKNEY